MSWTYISNLDEYDKEVTKDSSTEGRFTFKRYMYFKPSQYDQWSIQQSYNSVPYTAELVGNSNIPQHGTSLSGVIASLSNFYVNDIISIKNLSEQEHGDHCSYAQVTIEYENTPSNSALNQEFSDSQDSLHLKPWQKKVEDFTVTNQEIRVPLTHAYEIVDGVKSATKVPVTTTAGQVFYGFSDTIWIQRCTWTFNDRNSVYAIPSAIVNSEDVTLFNKLTIPAGCGLLMPPGYKKMYYYKDDNDRYPQEYDQWSFEIIVNDNGFTTNILNAGTQAQPPSGFLYDICTWYEVDLNDPELTIHKEFGTFREMMEAKMRVDEYNKEIEDERKKKVWNGDFVQSPVPLLKTGDIDIVSTIHPEQTYIRMFTQYDEGTWNLGVR